MLASRVEEEVGGTLVNSVAILPLFWSGNLSNLASSVSKVLLYIFIVHGTVVWDTQVYTVLRIS